MKQLIPVIIQVLFNQLVVGIPFTVVAFHVLQMRGYNYSRELPTFHWVLLELVVFTIAEEVFFYYSHRSVETDVMHVFSSIPIRFS